MKLWLNNVRVLNSLRSDLAETRGTDTSYILSILKKTNKSRVRPHQRINKTEQKRSSSDILWLLADFSTAVIIFKVILPKLLVKRACFALDGIEACRQLWFNSSVLRYLWYNLFSGGEWNPVCILITQFHLIYSVATMSWLLWAVHRTHCKVFTGTNASSWKDLISIQTVADE